MSNNNEPEPPGKGALLAGAELVKYITALATGAIVFSAGLIPEKVTFTPTMKWLLGAGWIVLALSVAAGLMAGARIPVQLAEKNYDWENVWLKVPAGAQQILFVLGMLLLGWAMILMLWNHKVAPDLPTQPCCPAGERGPQGPPGPPGQTGERGPQGERGAEGTEGQTGLRGPIGLRGAAGPPGRDGKKGDEGGQGPSGAAGSQVRSAIGATRVLTRVSTKATKLMMPSYSSTSFVTLPDMIITGLPGREGDKVLVLGSISLELMEGSGDNTILRILVDGAPVSRWQQLVKLGRPDGGPVSVPIMGVATLKHSHIHEVAVEVSAEKGESLTLGVYSRELNVWLF